MLCSVAIKARIGIHFRGTIRIKSEMVCIPFDGNMAFLVRIRSDCGLGQGVQCGDDFRGDGIPLMFRFVMLGGVTRLI